MGSKLMLSMSNSKKVIMVDIFYVDIINASYFVDIIRI